jgi:hypothetical protein
MGAAIWLDATQDSVLSVTINIPGTDYTSTPTVTFSALLFAFAGGTTGKPSSATSRPYLLMAHP